MISHNFKKKFGQNFIFDKNLLSAIVKDADIKKEDEVLEIGAGAGTLTEIISQNAKKVVSYEIDKDLEVKLNSLHLKNTTFVFGDIMKYDIDEIEKSFDGKYKMIANLPYYITTPIIFKFINESKNIESLCIMVQKEVAERIIAKKGNKDYGVLSIMIDFFGSAEIKRIVERKMFYPVPNVDSAVCLIKVDKSKHASIDGNAFYRFIQGCFLMRRKTLRNNLLKMGVFSQKLDSLSNFKLERRPEQLDIDEFIEIFKNIYS